MFLFGKHINKYYLKFLPFYLLGITALIIDDYVQLKVPQYLGEIVDKVENSTVLTIAAVSTILLALVKVAIISLFGKFIWRISIMRASTKTEAAIRKEMFLKSERLSQRYYHENKVGSVMAWFTTDLQTIEEFTSWGTVMACDAFFISAMCIYKMFSLNMAISVIAMIPLALIIVWGALVEKFMSMKWEHRQQQFDKLYDFTQESFTGIRVIKAFVKGTAQIHAFAKIAKSNKDANISFVKISVIFDVLISILISLVTAIILGFGGYIVYKMYSGDPVVMFGQAMTLSTGQLIEFIGYFNSIIWPMMALGQIVSMLSRCKASSKRINDYLNQEEEIKDSENAKPLEDVKGTIEFKNYSFQYPDGFIHSLDNISFKIEAGETIGIVGKIGSGKSTLVNSLLRLYNVEKGTIFIDGIDIMDATIASVRDSISYVPQDNFLFSDKIKNNIAFSNRNVDFEIVRQAAKFADVDSNIIDFKEGYDTISGERGVTLSGGQKQRISIARAFIKDAPIMIMDDSVSAVDVKTEETILKNIKEFRKGRTTIVIASRVSTVSHLNKILVLNEGKVEAFDTHENLLKISPTYSKMVSLQKLEKEAE